MFELLLADLAELSVMAWLVMMGCAVVIGAFVGACAGDSDG